MTKTPASATTKRLLSSIEADPLNSSGGLFTIPVAFAVGVRAELAVAPPALLPGPASVPVGTVVLEDRRTKEVAVAWMTVWVIVVVEAIGVVVS